jgi:cyanophycin synthetase
MGYESNEASVITNVSSDHLDLQGIHTLPELAEVKGVIARVTKPTGTVVLNADDRWVAALAREVGAPVAFFSLEGDGSALVRRHVRKGGRAYVVRDEWVGEAEGSTWRRFAPLSDIPIALGGIARHNVANALAAAGAARAMGVSIDDVGRGLRSFRPTAEDAPGRLNVFTDERRIVIVDFAHNEAGITVLLDVAAAMASTARGSITAIIGTAGDRPDDTLRGLGRIAAERADRVVIKETLEYLRGRTRASTIGELKAGAREGGWRRQIPVFESEVASLEHELDRTADGPPEVLVILCHEQRDSVFKLLLDRGFRAVTEPRDLAALV